MTYDFDSQLLRSAESVAGYNGQNSSSSSSNNTNGGNGGQATAAATTATTTAATTAAVTKSSPSRASTSPKHSRNSSLTIQTNGINNHNHLHHLHHNQYSPTSLSSSITTTLTTTATTSANPNTVHRITSRRTPSPLNSKTTVFPSPTTASTTTNKPTTVVSSTSSSKSSSSSSKNPDVVVKTKSQNSTPHKSTPRQTRNSNEDNYMERTPRLQVYFTYLCYYVLELFGHFREFIRRVGIEKRKGAVDNNTKEFAPLFNSFESFHTRNVYVRNRDCFNRPICSVPGAQIELLERKSDDYNWTYQFTGRKIKALNLGSYNYLGFAENSGDSSHEAMRAVRESGVSTGSPCCELGTLKAHRDLERLIAQFLRVEDSIVFGMGFATNSLNIPALLLSNSDFTDNNNNNNNNDEVKSSRSAKQSLIISDELNHTSLILGARLSGATIKKFKHNDVASLEKVLRTSIIEGHPVTRRPWKKILIIVEGVYSMEGTITPLPEIIALKKKYKAYLYLDEAHSIGAVGPSGRGIVEHFGCDPRDVDILMGTFSKSFGAAGGYLAGNRELISFVRHHSYANTYATSMSPPVCAQIHKTMEIIMGLDGSQEGQRRIKQLAENSRYFRNKLKRMGFIVYGNDASPIVPAMLYMPTKVALFNRMMLERGIAVVTVGFPATNLPGGRVRFCISAAHTREMLDYALEAIDYCGHMNGVKISRMFPAKSFQELKKLDAEFNGDHKTTTTTTTTNGKNNIAHNYSVPTLLQSTPTFHL